MENNWQPKLKFYPHFDRTISSDEALSYVQESKNIVSHKFYPFITFDISWTKYASKGKKGKKKTRLIRYSARRDSYIFSYYRHLLSEKYEARLNENGLSQTVLAYRRIENAKGKGSSNIDFAKLAFDKIKTLENCYVVAMDIKGFFDNLDHDHVKKSWADLLGEAKLPDDHFSVFKALTNFSDVEKIKVYERLGHYGHKKFDNRGNSINGYLTSKHEFKDNPQLCSAGVFRTKVVKERPRLITQNRLNYGIPQGAPLSDLLANLYLMRFDLAVKLKVEENGGTYLRYSDDILLILPTTKEEANIVSSFVDDEIRKCGSKIRISKDKTSTFKFYESEDGQVCQQVESHFDDLNTVPLNKILEYLGFSYDGQNILIRSTTLNNIQRKLTAAAKKSAKVHLKRYPNKSRSELIAIYNYEEFIKRYGRVRNFNSVDDTDDTGIVFKKWTFWTYIRRSIKTFEGDSNGIHRQLRNYKKHTKTIIKSQIKKLADHAGRDP